MRLVDKVKYLPDDLEPTLSALFAYRNAMFHSGFEWPRKELERFEKKPEQILLAFRLVLAGHVQ